MSVCRPIPHTETMQREVNRNKITIKGYLKLELSDRTIKITMFILFLDRKDKILKFLSRELESIKIMEV